MAKEANKPLFDESMVLDLMDQEIEETQRATHMEYVEMIEKIQEVLGAAETKNEELLSENKELVTVVAKQSDKVIQLAKENHFLQTAYDDILSQMDLCNMKKHNIEKVKEEIEIQFEDLKHKYAKTQRLHAEDADNKFNALNERIATLTSDNKYLEERLSSIMSAKSTSEDIQDITQSQLDDLNVRHKQILDENSKMRLKLEKLYKEKEELSNLLDARINDLDDVKREYKYHLERLEIEHANKIKDLTNGGMKERDRTITGIDKILGPGLSILDNNLDSILEENDNDDDIYRNLVKKQSIRDLLQRGSLALHTDSEDMNITQSGRTIDFPYHVQNNADLVLLEQIEEKDKEISKLREQMTEIKEKASKDMPFNPKQEEQIKKLTLDLKHEREKYDMLKEMFDKEKSHADKTIKEFEELFIHSKLTYQMEAAEKDQEELKTIKKMKLLNYQIKLYEDQINAFNKLNKKS